jgi:hypothetical protein
MMAIINFSLALGIEVMNKQIVFFGAGQFAAASKCDGAKRGKRQCDIVKCQRAVNTPAATHGYSGTGVERNPRGY